MNQLQHAGRRTTERNIGLAVARSLLYQRQTPDDDDAVPRGRFLKKNCGNAKGAEGVSPEIFFDFRSQIDQFWCKLGVFCAAHIKLV